MFCACGVMFVVENDVLNSVGEIQDLLSSLYFMVVVSFKLFLSFLPLFLVVRAVSLTLSCKTFTTVGYGDITPQSRIGRGLIIIFLVFILVFLPLIITRTAETFAEYSGEFFF